ncbi:MAG: DoxX family membrane protein [Candidatus Dormibacteria bacterium]
MKRSDLGLLALRLGAGSILATHGLPKLIGGEGRAAPAWMSRLLGTNYQAAWERSGPVNFGKSLANMGVPLPEVAARASGLAELGGGLGLMAGAGTPVAGLVAAANMAVAVRRAHWKQGFYGQGGYEFPLLLGVAALALALTGPGRISVDGWR